MALLFFTCPKTNQQAPIGIETDVQSLSVVWRATLSVHCPYCPPSALVRQIGWVEEGRISGSS